ncbi:MAG TPA: GYF domain-containing protein [Candidatus Methylacidiphilales bacterium]|jgi:hypothetical protein|nr:GYF domain-containing protein [Candidatus Methylacidiphilales bacterium]
MQIYIHRDGQQLGPYSIGQVRDYLAAGDLVAGDLAWHEGISDWVPLAQIEGAVPAPAKLAGAPSWVPQRRDGAEVEAPLFFADSGTRDPIPEPSPLPVAEEPPSEDGAPKKRQLSPIEKRRRKQKETGKQLMGFGALVFICGLGATVLTLCVAAGQGGGIFVIFLGLLVTGAVLFVAGYKQFTGT